MAKNKPIAPAPKPNTHERRDPQKLKNHPVNQKIYGDAVSVEFVEDVRNRGIQEEIHITEKDVVIAGHKRRQVALTIGIEEVRVLVRRDLKTPEDIIEALICSNQHQRERTTEQKAREFEHLREIEEVRAKERMAAGGKEGSPCEGLPSGKSTDIAAKQSGLGRNTAPKAAAVVKKIDELEESGDAEKADELRETLNNKSVAEADRQIQEPATEKKKPCDKNGNPIPKKALSAFEALGEFTSIKTRISNLKGDIAKLAETNAGTLIRFNPIKIDLENVYRAIRFGTPHCVCPYCNGKKKTCDGCNGTGWGGESLYKNAPEEMK